MSRGFWGSVLYTLFVVKLVLVEQLFSDQTYIKVGALIKHRNDDLGQRCVIECLDIEDTGNSIFTFQRLEGVRYY